MGLIKLTSVIFLASIAFAPVHAADTKDYVQYFDGAMTVYKKFKEFNAPESERFKSFIDSRWASSNCKNTSCLIDGKEAAKEYASRMRVPLENEIQ